MKNLDPPLSFLDFIKPVRSQNWQSKYGRQLDGEGQDRAERLVKQMKQLVFKKTYELRE